MDDFAEWELQMHANEPDQREAGFDAVLVYDHERRMRALDQQEVQCETPEGK